MGPWRCTGITAAAGPLTTTSEQQRRAGTGAVPARRGARQTLEYVTALLSCSPAQAQPGALVWTDRSLGSPSQRDQADTLWKHLAFIGLTSRVETRMHMFSCGLYIAIAHLSDKALRQQCAPGAADLGRTMQVSLLVYMPPLHGAVHMSRALVPCRCPARKMRWLKLTP